MKIGQTYLWFLKDAEQTFFNIYDIGVAACPKQTDCNFDQFKEVSPSKVIARAFFLHRPI
jgi:hypothetical protein